MISTVKSTNSLSRSDELKDKQFSTATKDRKITTLTTYSVPLCIDLDGTLVKTDTLYELFLVFLRTGGKNIILLPAWLAKGKANFKYKLAEQVLLDPAILPYHTGIINYICREKKGGRTIILVTAASKQLALCVADFLGFFDEILASSREHNLRGEAKLACLLARFGNKGFDYAGNDHTDIVIWKQARTAILVNPEPGVVLRVLLDNTNHLILDERSKSRQHALAACLGSQHWVINLIIFLPWLSSHRDPGYLSTLLVEYLAFSLVSGAIYSGAHLFFLHRDRQEKKGNESSENPLASGELPLLYGFVIPPILSILSAILLTISATGSVSYLLYLAYVTSQVLSQIMMRRKNSTPWLMRTCASISLLATGLFTIGLLLPT